MSADVYVQTAVSAYMQVCKAASESQLEGGTKERKTQVTHRGRVKEKLQRGKKAPTMLVYVRFSSAVSLCSAPTQQECAGCNNGCVSPSHAMGTNETALWSKPGHQSAFALSLQA